MQELFAALTHALQKAPALALGASFLWGVLSILLSPCHLTSIPLIVGFIGGQGSVTGRRALTMATLFALGILVTIGAIGGLTAALGRMLGDVGPYCNYVVAAILFAVGLYLLDVIVLPWSGPAGIGIRRRGPLVAFALGLLFGVAVGPCTFAYMAPMLAVTFKVSASNLSYGVGLLSAYGVGHCSVIVLAGAWTQWVRRYLNWNETSRGLVRLRRACGVLVILGGLYLIYITP